MAWAPEQLQKILEFQQVTEALLGELEQFGFRYKNVEHYDLRAGLGYPAWFSSDESTGIITLFSLNESGAVAHELGHGFHECLRRDFGIEDKFGEDYAEAIRWFAELKVGESDWSKNYKEHPRNANILNLCDWDWKRFVANLQARKFFLR